VRLQIVTWKKAHKSLSVASPLVCNITQSSDIGNSIVSVLNCVDENIS
jgi:hypothetical protein